jgi:hypothetical protein
MTDRSFARPLPIQDKSQIAYHLAQSGIRTTDLSRRAGEESTPLRQQGHCDRPIFPFLVIFNECNFHMKARNGSTCWEQDPPIA